MPSADGDPRAGILYENIELGLWIQISSGRSDGDVRRSGAYDGFDLFVIEPAARLNEGCTFQYKPFRCAARHHKTVDKADAAVKPSLQFKRTDLRDSLIEDDESKLSSIDPGSLQLRRFSAGECHKRKTALAAGDLSQTLDRCILTE